LSAKVIVLIVCEGTESCQAGVSLVEIEDRLAKSDLETYRLLTSQGRPSTEMAAIAAANDVDLIILRRYRHPALVDASEDLWDRVRLPEYIKPIAGGLLLGTIGILSFKTTGGFPRVFGVGYDSIGDMLFGRLATEIVLGLFIFKMLATVLTLGAGGSGGIFAPSLFMGAMMGGVFGQMAHHMFPAVTAPAGAYALVGMAAFFSGAAQSPVTAILILFEMTGDYRIILP
jgi:hypothetical protein